MPEKRIVIVGAGLAGLSCALRLQERGYNCQILEKSSCAGGRVRTHVQDGYRLDHGFQVLLTAYPKTQQLLDYAALELKAFHPGALVRYKGRFRTLGDPSRRPGDAFATLTAPIGNPVDKARILHLRNKVTSGTLEEMLARPEVTTAQRLREFGFSSEMVRQFFRPFLGGIFLEPDLVTSSRKFEFVMRMFSQGEAALPRLGMQAIPQQLATRLKNGVLQTDCRVASIANGVTLETGQHVEADIVVLATTEAEAASLQNKTKGSTDAAVTCHYYSASESPVKGPWLVLNGDATGPINNLCVPSELHPNYAPPGKSLISVTALGVLDGSSEKNVRKQLTDWYGEQASDWQHLRSFRIPHALSVQKPPALDVIRKPCKISDRLFVCGDYQSITSIEGAVASGLRCANEILN